MINTDEQGTAAGTTAGTTIVTGIKRHWFYNAFLILETKVLKKTVVLYTKL